MKALVTGAGGGIGKALVERMIQLNYQVLATDRDAEGLRALASAAGWPEDRIFLTGLDVTSAESWEDAFKLVEEKLGTLDLVFNVAGVMRAEWVQDIPLDDIDTVVDVDLKGVILGTRFAARHMLRSGSGHIVNFSSMLGLTPGPGLSVYTGAKYGVRGFTLSAALELEPNGIAVSLVCPDKVETRLFEFPNAHGPQAALAWSGPEPIDPGRLAENILREVVSRRPLVYCIPRHRGMLARCMEFLPVGMMRGMFAFLNAKGTRKQREFAAQRTDPTIPVSPRVASDPVVISKTPHLPPAVDFPIPDLSPMEVNSDDGDIRRIFSVARTTAASLGTVDIGQRLAWGRQIQRWLLDHRDELAREISREAGKDVFEAMVQELMFVIAAIEYDLRHARKALRAERVNGPPFHFFKRSTIHYQPLGVVLVLAPYNYPLALGLLPAVEALLAGNAVILKPSEQCSLASIWERLIIASELPAGAFQVCHGDAEVAKELIEAGPDHIHLTGGSETGAEVAGQAARKLISVSAELGGKDVAVVFPDADIDRAIECIVWAFLVHQGQTCASIKRLLVHESIYDSFLDRFVSRIEDVVNSTWKKPATDWQWEAPPFRADRSRDWIEAALGTGARMVFPIGDRNTASFLAGPLCPVIVGDVTPVMKLWQEETWGPLLAVGCFSDESKALEMANNCKFGLGASVWTRDKAIAKRFSEALDVGFVSINNALATMTNPALPYGGCKASGWGRTRGQFGLRAFCNVKSVLEDRGSMMEPYWHPYTIAKTRMFSDLIRGAFGRGWACKWKAFQAAGHLSNFMRRRR